MPPMSSIHISIAAATVPLSAMFGSKLGTFLAATEGVPSWAGGVLGPVGTTICTLIAVKWLTNRLDKSEAKTEQREAERLENFKVLVTLTTQNHLIIEQNSEVLTEVKEALRKQP